MKKHIMAVILLVLLTNITWAQETMSQELQYFNDYLIRTDTNPLSDFFVPGARVCLETKEAKDIVSLDDIFQRDTEITPQLSSITEAKSAVFITSMAKIQTGETQQAIALCGTNLLHQYRISHIQIGKSDDLAETALIELDNAGINLCEAWGESNVEGVLRNTSEDATIYDVAQDSLLTLNEYKNSLNNQWTPGEATGQFTIAVTKVTGSIAVIILRGMRSDFTMPMHVAYTLVWDEKQWVITHLAWFIEIAPIKRQIILPFDPSILAQLQERYIDATQLPNFYISPLQLPPSRRNRPCIKGDVLTWQDSVMRGKDYDIWGFNFQTQGLYLINAPAPESNQVHPQLSETGNYVIWTDDGADNTGIDLYGISLGKVTQVPWEAPLSAGPNNMTFQAGGQVLQRPFADPVVAVDGHQRGCRVTGYSFVYASQEPKIGNVLRVADLRTWPIKPIIVPITKAIMPCNADICDNWIVWQDYRNGNWDIFAYDMETEKEYPVCVNIGDQVAPRVSGGMVVWQDGRFDALCKGSEPKAVETPKDIYPKELTTKNKDDIPHWWIFIADLTNGFSGPIAGFMGPAMEPDIDGMMITWRDRSINDWDIFAMHLALPVPLRLTVDLDQEYQPSIYQNRLAWVSKVNNDEELWSLWWESAGDEEILRAFLETLPKYSMDQSSYYHYAYCWMLLGSQTVAPITDEEIQQRKLAPCPVCYIP